MVVTETIRLLLQKFHPNVIPFIDIRIASVLYFLGSNKKNARGPFTHFPGRGNGAPGRSLYLNHFLNTFVTETIIFLNPSFIV